MSQNTYKTFLEATSFKSLKNVADAARQVMLGEEQEKLEIQELVNIISAAKYLDENQKTAIIEIFGLSAADKEKKKREKERVAAAKEREEDQEAKKAQAQRDKEYKQREKDRAAEYARDGGTSSDKGRGGANA